jgi:antitoxin (DNA-binding transcriptional repressor) of toxin-antitoxin stability system
MRAGGVDRSAVVHIDCDGRNVEMLGGLNNDGVAVHHLAVVTAALARGLPGASAAASARTAPRGPSLRVDLVHFTTNILVVVKVNIHDAKTHLSEHLDRLEKGEEDLVVICRRNVPIAELRALPRRPTSRRPILRPEAGFTVPRTFFEALPDDLVDAFEGDP